MLCIQKCADRDLKLANSCFCVVGLGMFSPYSILSQYFTISMNYRIMKEVNS